MQLGAHFALSWFAAEAAGLERVRDRRIVALAGLAPDAEAVAYAGAYLYFGFDLDRAFGVWDAIHHRYSHGLAFALATVAVAWWFARDGPGDTLRALKVGALAGLVSLAHVFCDLIGAGPGWPVYPYWPLSDAPWAMPWSWNVSEWPNVAFSFAGFAAILVYARAAGRSPLETFSVRLDRGLARVMRGEAAVAPASAGRLRWIIYGVLALATAAIVAPLAFWM
jgi:hypothetical protein